MTTHLPTAPPSTRASDLLSAYSPSDACAAELLCDRHPADAVAFTLVEPDLTGTDITYGQLKERSERVARGLAELGVGRGDRVATLMGKSEDLVAVLLGIWRLGAVHVPLFTAFATPAIALRLVASAAKVVVCDANQRHKLDSSDDLPQERFWKIVVAGSAAGELAPGDLALADVASAPPGYPAARMGGAAPIVKIFTSGTTGAPKAVHVPVNALAAFQIYIEYGLDVRPDDVFWNAADPGWAYGLYYGILGPLVTGRRSILLHAAFAPELSWKVLDRLRGHQLRGRADRLPGAAGGRGRRTAGPVAACVLERGRAAEPGDGRLVRARPRGAHPRPLRADRARHGDHQRLAPRHPAPGQAGLDGPSDARLGGRGAAARPRRGGARRNPRPGGHRHGGEPADVVHRLRRRPGAHVGPLQPGRPVVLHRRRGHCATATGTSSSPRATTT